MANILWTYLKEKNMFDRLDFEEIKTQPMTPFNRRIQFVGAKNFRDIGGYHTVDGKTVRWGVVYRSDALNKLTTSDLKFLSALNLQTVVDFRSEHEVKDAPDRLLETIRYVKLPILDSSTKVWHESRDEFIKNLARIDSLESMMETNIEFATKFTPEIKSFFAELFAVNGKPILFHCAVGKDRTGFVAAVLLKILGVPYDVVMEDYLLTNQYILPSFQRELTFLRMFRGKRFADVVKGFMEARPEYVSAAFDAIDRAYGSFDSYVFEALGLSIHDVNQLKAVYLE
jgi:protein-tyrosine phosphatase